MTIALTLGATTATTQSFTFTTMGASGTVDLQISPRRDFQFCVCPIYSVPRATPYVANGLNQDATYFARARTVLADGTTEDWSNIVAFRTPVAAARVTAPAAVMIDLACIAKPEEVVGWTPGNEQAGFPALNVSRDSPVAWHSINAGGAHAITLEHSGAPIDVIAVLNTNLPEATTVTIRVGATAAAAAAAAATVNAAAFRASANLPGRNGYHGFVRLAAPVAAKFIRIELNGVTPAGLLHLEHIILGLDRRSKNHALDKSESPLHKGSIERTRSGVADRRRGLQMRKVEFDIGMMTEAQYETLYADLIYQQDEAIFVIPNSKVGGFLHDRMLFGDLSGGRVVNPTSPRYTRTFVVDSLI